jgi:Reverse transcriptase (RNA-dependent DNA polymerase)
VIGVPRSGGSIRWLTQLSPPDQAAYAEVVAPLVPGIEASLSAAVLANRIAPAGHGLRLADWRPAWHLWRRWADTASHAPAVLVADVVDCYGQLRPATVTRALRELGANADDARRVRRWLDRTREHGVRGLPVGPAPSAVLANAALAAVDARLIGVGTRHVRWVDDFIVVAWSPRAALRAYDAVSSALDRLGLAVHAGKSAILCDPEEIRGHLGRPPSVVDPSRGGSSPSWARRGMMRRREDPIPCPNRPYPDAPGDG